MFQPLGKESASLIGQQQSTRSDVTEINVTLRLRTVSSRHALPEAKRCLLLQAGIFFKEKK